MGLDLQYPNGAINEELHVPIKKAVVCGAIRRCAARTVHTGVPLQDGRRAWSRARTMWFQAIKEGELTSSVPSTAAKRHSNMLSHVHVTMKRVTRSGWRKPTSHDRSCQTWTVALQPRGLQGLPTRWRKARWSLAPVSQVVWRRGKLYGGGNTKMDENYIRESILEPQRRSALAFERASAAVVPRQVERRTDYGANRPDPIAQGRWHTPTEANSLKSLISDSKF